MNMLSLFLVLSLVAVALAISKHQKFDLEKDILVGSVRAFIQLMAVGYILNYVFASEDWRLTLFILSVMIIIAAENAAKRGQGIPNVFSIVVFAIGLGTAVTLSIMLGFRIIQFRPDEVIPISGMIIGNAMVASGLTLHRLKDEVTARKMEIQTLLALGATSRQAVDQALKASVKSGMIPTIDSMKTIGLVQLPGMMTGFILAGGDPLQAVRYQLLVVFMLTGTVAISCLTVGLSAYRKFFTKNHQLIN